MSENLPSEQEALKFLAQSGCSHQVIRHCKAVMQIATQIADACIKRGKKVDVGLVRIGALMHDIGRSRTHDIHHVIKGVEIAKSLRVPKSVLLIIQCHVGGGITPKEAEKLGWPKGCYLPHTLEEKIVAYADKLTEGGKRVKIDRTLEKLSKELGSTHPAIDRVKKLHEELSVWDMPA